MSTPLGSSQFFLPTPTEVGQSLRFDDGLSNYLSRTPSSAGNRKTFTISLWLKRGNITAGYILRASEFYLYYTSDGALNYYDYRSGADGVILTTNAVYRDASAWYHIVLASDRTQSTAADRVKLYVNNEQITSFATATYPATTEDSYFNNSSTVHYLGGTTSNYFDGYIANACFIDGQQLDPTSFGEYKNTLWKPKSDYAVQALTFGTNGFYLNFADTTSLTTLGDDTSGNGNDWTLNNFTLNVAPSSDAPVLGGNFCILDPNYSYPGLSYGNLVHYNATAGWTSAAGTFTVSSGKWYYEYYVTNVDNSATFLLNGWAKIGSSNVVSNLGWYPGSTATSYGLFTTGAKYNNATGTAGYASAQVNGDIVGVALDLDAGTLTYYVNGVSQGTAFSGLSGEFFPAIGTYGGIAILNFGQDGLFSGNKTSQGNTDANGLGDFYHTVPTDHLALVSANLPTPTITAPDEYFNTLLWTGDGTSSRTLTNVGFQPDFNWVKSRSSTAGHVLHDSVRGSDAYGLIPLTSHSTAAESTFDATWHSNFGSLDSLDSDGFTVTDGSLTGAYNTSGETYAAWNWLADTAFSNSAGTNGADLASSGRVNQKAGFSIVSFDLEATGSKTVLHGLSSAPEMIIVKSRSTATLWVVYTEPTGNTTYLSLNDTAGASTNSTTWDNTSPTSSVFTLGSGFTTGNYGAEQIAYCFHSVEGYSKIGSYTSNGSADGTFVHCGFRPAFVMIKITTSGYGWVMKDSLRAAEYNPATGNLYADDTLVEDTTSTANIDLLSNGFKLRGAYAGTNSTGAYNYIFYAVAEAPFKLANAR